MSARGPQAANGWQLILADLALILFLVTLVALASEPPDEARAGTPLPHIAPAQALFRPDPAGPDIARWLATRPQDHRATLTIFARHSGEDRRVMWEQAQAMSAKAASEGYSVRVIITRGTSSDLYASLAYDAEAPAR